MAIDLYMFLPSPPSRATLITAKYLGVDVNVKVINLFAGETRTPEFLKLNPSHTVPVLDDNGFVISESRAIMVYLVNKYCPNNSIYPSDAQARALVDKILYFDASTLYPAQLATFLPITRDKTEPTQEVVDNLKEKVQILEQLLGEQKFFAGNNATLADISMAVSVPIMRLLFANNWTHKLDQWYERVCVAVPEVKQYNDQIDYKQFIENLEKK